MSVSSNNTKTCDLLFAYKIKYFVFISKESIVHYSIANIFGPLTSQFARQVLIIAPYFHSTKTVSPYFPARSRRPKLFQEPTSLIASQVSLGMNFFCGIWIILSVESNGIGWIVIIIMTSIVH